MIVQGHFWPADPPGSGTRDGELAELWQKVEDAVEERLIKTGKMTVFRYGFSELRLLGPVSGQPYRAMVFHVHRDLEAFREWLFLPEHVEFEQTLFARRGGAAHRSL